MGSCDDVLRLSKLLKRCARGHDLHAETVENPIAQTQLKADKAFCKYKLFLFELPSSLVSRLYLVVGRAVVPAPEDKLAEAAVARSYRNFSQLLLKVAKVADRLSAELRRHITIAHRESERLDVIIADAPVKRCQPIVVQLGFAFAVEEVKRRPNQYFIVLLAATELRIAQYHPIEVWRRAIGVNVESSDGIQLVNLRLGVVEH